MKSQRKNRYVHRAKISEAKFRQFLGCFALDMEATKIARLTRLNRNTVNRLGRAVRERIADACAEEQKHPREVGSANRTVRILRTRIGRRSGWRIVSAQILPDGKVQVQVEEAPWSRGATMALNPPASAPLTDYSSANEVSAPGPTVEGINSAEGTGRVRTLDNFWGQAVLRLAKFKGVSHRTYHLHLKECQFRFNHRREDLYALLLRLIRNRPLF